VTTAAAAGAAAHPAGGRTSRRAGEPDAGGPEPVIAWGAYREKLRIAKVSGPAGAAGGNQVTGVRAGHVSPAGHGKGDSAEPVKTISANKPFLYGAYNDEPSRSFRIELPFQNL
jgi:hypothetical protein